MSTELAQRLKDAAPVPQSPVDPDAVWTAGRERQRRQRRRSSLLTGLAFVAVVTTGVVVLSIGDADDHPRLTTGAPDRGPLPEDVGALANTDPLELITVFGDTVDWSHPPGVEAGAPVTEANAAAAYGPLPLPPPAGSLDSLREQGWTSGATQLWRYELAGVDTGWSSIRVTVSRFESLAEYGDDPPWRTSDPSDYTPADAPGPPPPEGIDYVCRGDRDASAQYYPGALYDECNITVGDTTWISISSVHPGSNSEQIYEILDFWLGSVA